MGSIVKEAIVKAKINQIRVKDVLHVFELQSNLLSVGKLVSNGLIVQFKLNECFVKFVMVKPL